jgi:IS4 transposase
MFDPTAFDNMKVIIEGLLYDKDLDGEYEITDRNDFVNLSKMDRLFSIRYKKVD